jgi:SRSO17 transposase
LALSLSDEAWQVVEWREGSNDVLKGRFARVRVHAAHRDSMRSELRPEEWLIIEWPESEKEPTKYWLSTLPPDIAFAQLVDAIKLRWRKASRAALCWSTRAMARIRRFARR